MKMFHLMVVVGLGAGVSACDESVVSDEAPAASEFEDLEDRAFQLGTTYTIRNVQTGLCIDIPWGLASSVDVNQYPCHAGPAQQFIMNAFIGQLSTVRNVSSGKCVTAGGFWNNGYSVHQQDCNPSIFPQSVEVRTIANHSDGATVVLNSAYDSGVCLAAPNTTSPANLRFELCDGGQDQQWRLSELAAPTCDGFCGGQAAGGCWCDDQCSGFGDCCGDYQTYCASDDGGGDGGDGGGSSECSAGQVCCEPNPSGGCWLCVPNGAHCP